VKKSRFTDEQIAFALKQAETGSGSVEICHKMGISDATFCKWRQKYGDLGPLGLRKHEGKMAVKENHTLWCSYRLKLSRDNGEPNGSV
jgi:putative transposase